MKIAYFDCFAGAAGDMLVASMLDAGLDPDLLRDRLATLPLPPFELKITKTTRAGIAATRFEPLLPPASNHRNLSQIIEIINAAALPENVRATAIAVFKTLAEAEAAVHATDVEHVHFHEVGALDSIIDVVAAAVGIDALEIEQVFASPLTLGGGTVDCSHGTIPAPAPATTELLKGIPVVGGPINAELLTPTAAAFFKTLAKGFGHLPEMKIDAVGYGAGSMNPERFPNVIRLLLGTTDQPNLATADTICLLQTNCDDVTAELLAHVTEILFQAGALDVFTTPIIMKHGRPAAELTVIAPLDRAEKLQRIIFQHGLTFGLRKQLVPRAKLARRFETVSTPFGNIRIKLGLLDGKVVAAKPEFADCADAAKKHNLPLKTILDAALTAYHR